MDIIRVLFERSGDMITQDEAHSEAYDAAVLSGLLEFFCSIIRTDPGHNEDAAIQKEPQLLIMSI